MAATLLIQCRDREVILSATGEPLAQRYKLGKGELQWWQGEDGPIVAWFSKTGAKVYEHPLGENGDYMVTPSSTWRAYTDEERADLDSRVRFDHQLEQAEAAHARRRRAAGRDAMTYLRNNDRLTSLMRHQTFVGEETPGRSQWISDGQISRESIAGDMIRVTICGATWARLEMGTRGMTWRVVVWGLVPDELIERLGDEEQDIQAAVAESRWANRSSPLGSLDF